MVGMQSVSNFWRCPHHVHFHKHTTRKYALWLCTCELEMDAADALQKTVNCPNLLLISLSSIFVFTRKDYLQILPLVIKARKPMASFPTGSNFSDWHYSTNLTNIDKSLCTVFLSCTILWSCKSDGCHLDIEKRVAHLLMRHCICWTSLLMWRGHISKHRFISPFSIGKTIIYKIIGWWVFKEIKKNLKQKVKISPSFHLSVFTELNTYVYFFWNKSLQPWISLFNRKWLLGVMRVKIQHQP